MDPPWGDGYYRKVVNEAKEQAMKVRPKGTISEKPVGEMDLTELFSEMQGVVTHYVPTPELRAFYDSVIGRLEKITSTLHEERGDLQAEVARLEAELDGIYRHQAGRL